MKLSVKLPLAFAISLLLLCAGGMFGIYRLNQAVASYANDVLLQVAGHKMGAEIAAHFATAIQEWKNVLLRGKDAKDREKYWAAHQKEMTDVSALIEELDKLLGPGSPTHPLVAQLRLEIPQAQSGYLAAFEAYKASDNNFVNGDAAAKEKDRQAAATLT